MANQWFKFYGGEYLSDPKMLALTAAERSCWLTLLCYASMSGKDGAVRHLTEDILMAQSGVNPSQEQWNITKGLLKKFESLNIVSLTENCITIKNWSKRQEMAMTGYERTRKYRENAKNQLKFSTGDGNDNGGDANDNARIEENRIEENREYKRESTPREQTEAFWMAIKNQDNHYQAFKKRIVETYGAPEKIINKEMAKFYSYWTEKNHSGTKERWQQEKTFEVRKRLATWLQRVGYRNSDSQQNKGRAIII